MNFLVILAAVAVEFAVTSMAGLRSARWSLDWARWVCRLLGRQAWWRGWPAALVLLLAPAAVAWAVFAMLHAVAPPVAHLGGLLVLLACLGPEDLGAVVEAHKQTLNAAGGDEVAPPDFVVAAQGIELGEPTGDGEYDRRRVELAALAVAADRAWYQPLFWYFVLGPVGAVLYRQAANLRGFEAEDVGVTPALATAVEALEWLPARLSAFALGVAGTLVPVLETVSAVGLTRFGQSGELVARGALAAADEGRIREVIAGDPALYRVNQMFGLLRRAVAVWLVLLAGAALLFA